jgi:hypothetical protein
VVALTIHLAMGQVDQLLFLCTVIMVDLLPLWALLITPRVAAAAPMLPEVHLQLQQRAVMAEQELHTALLAHP